VLLAVYGTRLMQDVVCCIHNYCYTEQVLLNVLETGLCCFELLPTFSANQLQTLRRVWIGYGQICMICTCYKTCALTTCPRQIQANRS
jgi:hypothetical protein